MKIVRSRLKKLEHDYAVLAWICCVHPDVRKDVKANYSKKRHMDAVERAVTKLLAHRLDVPIATLLNTFWKEWKFFSNETGVYEKRNMWNVKDILEGKSAEWHELYSFGRTEVFGFIATRCTSALTGMGASERAWAVTKKIKSSTRSRLKGPKAEKLSIISTSYKLNKVRMHRREMEKLNCVHAGALWGDEDECFNLELENFGVDLDAINDTPTCPKRVFHCWIEKWEDLC